jgi:hypothetical protein
MFDGRNRSFAAVVKVLVKKRFPAVKTFRSVAKKPDNLQTCKVITIKFIMTVAV